MPTDTDRRCGSPVLEDGAREREVALPRGRWIETWSGHELPGGAETVVAAPLERILVWVRAGADAGSCPTAARFRPGSGDGRKGRDETTILAAVHLAALTGPEQRVLGCLVEKRWTTPDQYPLSLNALRLACNQATNRDPVTDYGEATVRDAVQRLAPYGLTRLASGHQSRAIKYRHLAEEGLGLDRPQLALLCVLLLRGPQTPGELKSRSERLSPTTLPEVEQRLGELIGRGYVRRLGRRPGQKEDRFEQLLGGEDESVVEEGTAVGAGPDPDDDGLRPPADTEPLSVRVTALEDAVHALRNELGALREELG